MIVNPFNADLSNSYSLSFDGTNDFVDADNCATAFDACNAEGTFVCWINTTATSGSKHLFRAVADANNEIFIFWHNSSDEWRFTYEAGGTGRKVQHSAGTTDSDTTWRHFAMTWSASADELKAYVNGTIVEEPISSLGTFSGTIAAVDFGSNTAGGAYFKGYMDEVAIWNEALTAAEITAIYNGGTGHIPFDKTSGAYASSANLKGWWRFEEGSGGLIDNARISGTDLVLTNGATHNSTVL